jgi:hypothetical protein
MKRNGVEHVSYLIIIILPAYKQSLPFISTNAALKVHYGWWMRILTAHFKLKALPEVRYFSTFTLLMWFLPP